MELQETYCLTLWEEKKATSTHLDHVSSQPDHTSVNIINFGKYFIFHDNPAMIAICQIDLLLLSMFFTLGAESRTIRDYKHTTVVYIHCGKCENDKSQGS